MVYIQAKNPSSGKFWRALKWTMLNFMAIWNLLQPFGTYLHFMAIFNIHITAILYILWPFGNLLVMW
jgi:hypothetical protein